LLVGRSFASSMACGRVWMRSRVPICRPCTREPVNSNTHQQSACEQCKSIYAAGASYTAHNKHAVLQRQWVAANKKLGK
jgi:ribosomal protein L37AE/L43A